jgi:hypothetical protein
MAHVTTVFNVEDAAVARVFADTRRRHLLLSLVGQERSLQELARAAGMAPNLAHYHVGRLHALGLIRIARRQARSGRPIKHYTAVADSFFVPSHLTSRSHGEKLSAELRAALERRRVRNVTDGTVYYVDSQNTARMRRVQAQASHSAMESWCILNLTAEDARTLAGEIKQLLARFERPRGNSSRAYLAYCAITPRLSR